MANQSQYLTLGLDRETFGIGVEHVHEILDLRPISALPQAPPFLLGMIDVRGQSYPVIDLRTKLGLSPAEPTSASRIILLNVPLKGGPTRLGLVADRVFEVTDLEGDAMEPPPEVGGRWRASYIAGIGRKGSGFVVVFDLAALMASDGTEDLVAPLAA